MPVLTPASASSSAMAVDTEAPPPNMPIETAVVNSSDEESDHESISTDRTQLQSDKNFKRLEKLMLKLHETTSTSIQTLSSSVGLALSDVNNTLHVVQQKFETDIGKLQTELAELRLRVSAVETAPPLLCNLLPLPLQKPAESTLKGAPVASALGSPRTIRLATQLA